MASHQRRPWIGLLTASSYKVGLWILLLDSVIDIATSSTSSLWSFPSLVSQVVGSSGVGSPGVGSPGVGSPVVGSQGVGSGFVTSIAICFRGLPLGLSSPAGAFFFDEAAVSNGHLLSSLVFCSDSSKYGSLAMITYLVFGAQAQKCFVVSGLYPMKMPCQTFWQSNFDLFSSGMLHKARRSNIRTC